MITYDEAYKIAKEKKEAINKVIEYENGYVFCHTEDAKWDGGAGHVPVVILKADGKAVTMPYFLFQVGKGEKIAERKVS